MKYNIIQRKYANAKYNNGNSIVLHIIFNVSYPNIPPAKVTTLFWTNPYEHEHTSSMCVAIRTSLTRPLSGEPLRNNELWSGGRRQLHKSIEYGLLTNIYGV